MNATLLINRSSTALITVFVSFILLILSSVSIASALTDTGNGSDGALVINSGSTVTLPVTRASVLSAVSIGDNEINVPSTSGFAVGQKVLIIQMFNFSSSEFANKTQSEEATIAEILNSPPRIKVSGPITQNYIVDSYAKAQIIKINQYTNVTVTNNSTLTLDAWDGSTGGLLFLKVNGNLQIDAGSKIDLSAKGYRANEGPGGGITVGGAGGSGTGGSYGGKGGDPANILSGPYASEPYKNFNLGSGGASGSSFGCAIALGGAGGGALKVQANNITINGVIEANGGKGGSSSCVGDGAGGGGSGGAIYIISNNPASANKISTLLSANGADGGTIYGFSENSIAGGGGGGRIKTVSPTNIIDSEIPTLYTGGIWNGSQGSYSYLPDYDYAFENDLFVSLGLSQFRFSDGIELTSNRYIVSENQIILRAKINNASTSSGYKAQFEVKDIEYPFDGNGVIDGGNALSGQTSSATFSNLQGKRMYKWRSRLIDDNGQTSKWFYYNQGNEAFYILVLGQPDVKQFNEDNLEVSAASVIGADSIKLRVSDIKSTGSDNFKAQFEVKPIDESFNWIGIVDGNVVPFGGDSEAIISGFESYKVYKWRARLVDEEKRAASEWVEFNESNLAFTVFGLPKEKLKQYKIDNSEIATASNIDDDAVVLKINKTQGVNDSTFLYSQFEVKPVGTPFTGKRLVNGNTVLAGNDSEALVNGLTSSTQYKWRARVIDQNGKISSWAYFNDSNLERIAFKTLENSEAVWATQGDFEQNASTTQQTTTSSVDIESWPGQVKLKSDLDLGDGSDGALSVNSGAQYVLPVIKTVVSSSSNAGQNILNVSYTSGFSAGQKIYIIENYGSGVVKQEEAKVSAVLSSPVRLQLSSNLVNSYSNAQVIKINQFSNVTITNGSTLVADAFNGSNGGVLYFKANGVVQIDSGSAIDLTKKGYVGGAGSSYSGSPGQGPGAGGGGGYAKGGAAGGGYANNGGAGGSYGPAGGKAYSGFISPGSGGGGGGGSGSVSGTNGGIGGGAIKIDAKSLSLSGNIYTDGGSSTDYPGVGGGGGGSGGSIYITTEQLLNSNSANKLYARGGNGGSGQMCCGQTGSGGTGGGGSGGRIKINGPSDINIGSPVYNGGNGGFAGGQGAYIFEENFSYKIEGLIGGNGATTGLRAQGPGNQAVKWSRLKFNYDPLLSTEKIAFQIKTANSTSELSSATYKGPDGTSGTWFDESSLGASVVTNTDGSKTAEINLSSLSLEAKYGEVQVKLSGDRTSTPVLDNVVLSYELLSEPPAEPISQPPATSAEADLKQYFLDGSSEMAIGTKINENSVILKVLAAELFYPASLVNAQFEVKPLSEPFNGINLIDGNKVLNGFDSQAIIPDLSPGVSYKWRSRLIDNEGRISDWTNYNSGGLAFEVLLPLIGEDFVTWTTSEDFKNNAITKMGTTDSVNANITPLGSVKLQSRKIDTGTGADGDLVIDGTTAYATTLNGNIIAGGPFNGSNPFILDKVIPKASNTYNFKNITLKNGAVLTNSPIKTMVNKSIIHLKIKEKLDISGGAINLDGKGYSGGEPGNYSNLDNGFAGNGMGGGFGGLLTAVGATGGGGAGYGGAGGKGVGFNEGGHAGYALPTSVPSFGSGGGGGIMGIGGTGGAGGAGGGAIKIETDLITGSGAISANGNKGSAGSAIFYYNNSASGGGGGSGGGISIVSNNVVNSTNFSAKGGLAEGAQSGGGGGGGRITIDAPQITGIPLVTGGTSSGSYREISDGNPGVYSPIISKPYYNTGSIGGRVAKRGLRFDVGSGKKAKWESIKFNGSSLTNGQAIKFAIKTSDDGLAWTEPLGYDGQPIDWTSSGNYLGKAASDSAATQDILYAPPSRYIDIVVYLESDGTNTPALDDVTLKFNTNDVPLLPTSTNINQYQSDGVTGIIPGSKTSETSVILKAMNVAGMADSNLINAQFEVKPFGSQFNGVSIVNGNTTLKGGSSIATISDLVPGTAYKWRSRVVDQDGRASAWYEFNGILQPDFIIDETASPESPIWTTKEDFENNASTTGEITSNFNIDSQTLPGAVKLAPVIDMGDGSDGALNVNSGGTYTLPIVKSALSATSNAGQKILSVTSSAGFTVGQRVMVIQMFGAGIGNQEEAQVTAVGSGTITLKDNLQNTYSVSASASAQVIKIYQYTNVTISNNTALTVTGYASGSGGILNFRTTGTVTVDSGSSINLNAKGYSGGPGVGGNGSTCSTTYASAGGGGGGGAYGGDGTAGFSGTASSSPQSCSAPGGAKGIAYPSFLNIGSSGGWGAKSGGPGGLGGGALKMQINNLVLNGNIYAGGGDGGGGYNSGGAGGGGGGAGGGVNIISAANVVNANLITATGGIGAAGTSSTTWAGTMTGGKGGNGGGGRIRIETPSSVTGTPVYGNGNYIATTPAPYYSYGTIGGASATGLRLYTGGSKAIWRTLKYNSSSLINNQAVKFAVRVSDDGSSWSTPLGRDGKPVKWSSDGNYFGKSATDSTNYTDLIKIRPSKYIDIVVRLEANGPQSPILYDVDIKKDAFIGGIATWTNKEDFENNASTTGTPSINQQINTTNSIGDVKLGIGVDVGTGADGMLSVGGSTFNLNSSASGGRSQPDGYSTTLSAAASLNTSSISVASAGGALAAGDEILIAKLWTSTNNTSGIFETKRISSISGNTITLESPLTKSFTSGALVQRIPNYSSVNIGSAGILTANSWNGSTGGIVIFRAKDLLTVASGGIIDVSAKGYRGLKPAEGLSSGTRRGGNGGNGDCAGSPGRYSDGDFGFGGGGGVNGGLSNCTSAVVAGGSGGGSIRIYAKALNIDANAGILANGGNGNNSNPGGAGGGAGGLIHIETADVFANANKIKAAGGNGGTSNQYTQAGEGGSGGKVTIVTFPELSNPVVNGGLGGTGGVSGAAGSAGEVSIYPYYFNLGTLSELRLDGGNGITSTWESLMYNADALLPGQAIKFAVRTSDDGLNWSQLLGRDGNPINWSTGAGNYFGKAYTDPLSFKSLSVITPSRFIDLSVKLESQSKTDTPVLNDINLVYATITKPQEDTLKQYRLDNTEIVAGGWTGENAVQLKLSNVQGVSSSSTLRAQFEVKAVDEPFDETSLIDGSTVLPSETSTATINGLEKSKFYKWRARVVDQNNEYSNWINFNNDNVAFYTFLIKEESLKQYRSNGTTEIDISSWTNETSVMLKVLDVQGPVGTTTLKAQFEIKPLNEPFNGLSLVDGNDALLGGTSSAAISGLNKSSSYKWRSRLVDQNGNAGGWTSINEDNLAFYVFAPIQSSLKQLNNDGITEIALGADTDEKSVVLKVSNVQGLPDSTLLQAQFEVKPVNEPFNEQSLVSGSTTSAGGFSQATISDLSRNTSYKWRARIFDKAGRLSGWTNLAADENATAFKVSSLLATNLKQYEANGITEIAADGYTTDNSLVLKVLGVNNGSSASLLRAEFEVKPLSTPFNGNGLIQGNQVAPNEDSQATISNLLSSEAYKWRARIVDANGTIGSWSEYNNGLRAFFIYKPKVASFKQYRLDEQILIAPGTYTNEESIVLKVNDVKGPSGSSSIKAQFEVKRINEVFNEQGIITGSVVSPGAISKAVIPNLQDSATYKWRARLVNQSGKTSSWEYFNQSNSGIASFYVALSSNTVTWTTQQDFEQNAVTKLGQTDRSYINSITQPGSVKLSNREDEYSADDFGTGAQGSVIITNSQDIASFINGYDPSKGVIPNFENLTIKSGGVLKTTVATSASSNFQPVALEFKIRNNLVIESGGTISADKSGFGGGYPFCPAESGNAGAGLGGGLPSSGAGSYGGKGGGFSGDVYGALPSLPVFGSGGAATSSCGVITSYSYGGPGGGLIKVKAKRITLNGEITADGGSGAGGGSGGGVYIESTNGFDVSKISVLGGTNAGGGGRVVVNTGEKVFGQPLVNGASGGGAGTFNQITPYRSPGFIGGESGSSGLKVDAGEEKKVSWKAVTFNALSLIEGQAIKFAIKTSIDGLRWSEAMGRDGGPINWTTGSGNYLGRAYSDNESYMNISGVASTRFIDIIVRLESESGIDTPVLDDVTMVYANRPFAAVTGTPHTNYTQDTDMCALCHNSHTAVNTGLLGSSQYQAELCYNCHDGSGSKYNIKTAVDSNASYHPIKDDKYNNGVLNCTSCHNPHGDKDENGNYYPKLLRAKKTDGSLVFQGNEFCGVCHGEGSALVGGDHLTIYNDTQHNQLLPNPVTGTKIKCLNCHGNNNAGDLEGGGPHGSDFSRITLLKEEELCFGCHNSNKNSEKGLDIKAQFSATPSDPGNNQLNNQADNVFNVRHNVDLKEQILQGSKLECTSCHNPHLNSRANKLANPDNINTLFTDTIADPSKWNRLTKGNIGYIKTQPDTSFDGIAGIESSINSSYPLSGFGGLSVGYGQPSGGFKTNPQTVNSYGVQPAGVPNYYLSLMGDVYGKMRTLVKFDQSNIDKIPEGSQVTNATLRLYTRFSSSASDPWGTHQYTAGPAIGYNVDLYKVLEDWSNQTVSWNTQPAFDNNTNIISNIIYEQRETVNNYVLNFNITPLINEWRQNPEANKGMMLIATSAEEQSVVDSATANVWRAFGSDFGPQYNYEAPKLIIEYTNPSPPSVTDEVKFCLKCHDNNPPAGVKFPTSYSIRNIAQYYTDAHGSGAGVSGFGVKGPYYKGYDPIPCSDCHSPHGNGTDNHRIKSCSTCHYGLNWMGSCGTSCHYTKVHASRSVGGPGQDEFSDWKK